MGFSHLKSFKSHFWTKTMLANVTYLVGGNTTFVEHQTHFGYQGILSAYKFISNLHALGLVVRISLVCRQI